MKQIRAYHKTKKEWRWAVLGSDQTYARLDPYSGENLHDFDLFEVEITKKDHFKIIKNINHLPRVYS